MLHLRKKLSIGSQWLFPSLFFHLALPADAAGGEEEPVHEDAGAVVVGVIGQQPVPLVLLLTGAVPGAAEGALLGADLLKKTF